MSNPLTIGVLTRDGAVTHTALDRIRQVAPLTDHEAQVQFLDESGRCVIGRVATSADALLALLTEDARDTEDAYLASVSWA